jgi:class 3 adenylate cyclase
MELRSARAAFDRLGASLDAQTTGALLATAGRPSVPVRARRTFMFTDIVGSTSLLEAIGDEAWNDLRHWHDETLRASIARHEGEEVDHTGDGFFVAFPDVMSAVACAREIQGMLAEHRRDHGFAPQVRIGLHASDATRTAGSYSGIGIHTAARIAALARGGEILASEDMLEELGELEVGDRRSVDLKGIAEPVQVVSIPWQS